MKFGLILFIGSLLLVLTHSVSLELFIHSYFNKYILIITCILYISSYVSNHFFAKNNLTISNITNKWKQFILLCIVGICSGFVNNTILIVILANLFKEKSKYLIPLNYIITIGGLLTIFGSSTNIIFYNLLHNVHMSIHPFAMFGLAFILLVSSICYVIFYNDAFTQSIKESVQIVKPTKLSSIINFYLILSSSICIGNYILHLDIYQYLSSYILYLSDSNYIISLLILFLFTTVITNIVTNNTAILICFPLAYQLSNFYQTESVLFYMITLIAATCSFCTSIGYQTNLIVKNITECKETDFMKYGIPLTLLICLISILICPFIWKI